MKSRKLLQCCAALFFGLLPLGLAKPNVIIVIGDDVGYDAFGCTGNSYAKTPEVDRLAKESLVFDRFYGTVSQCAPIRAELYTGLFPVNNGVLANGVKTNTKGVKSIVDHLEPLGYRVGLAGKLHFKLGRKFTAIEGFTANGNGSVGSHSLTGVRAFINESLAADKNFCVVVASIHAHHPWDLGDQTGYDVAKAPVPPQYVDTPTTREVIRRHAAEVGLLDKQVGDVHRMLTDMSLTKDTLLIFLSEQGIAMPRAKWSVYDKGNRSLAIFHWPTKIKAGRTRAMAQYCDVVPTLVDLAGGKDPQLDGISLRPVIEGKSQDHRQSVFLSNVDPTWQRAIIRDDWKLIWSPARDRRHLMYTFDSPKTRNGTYRKFFTGAWKEWQAAAKSNPAAAQKVRHVTSPERFELYHIDRDYDEVTNLAQHPENATKVQTMFAELKATMARLKDPLYTPAAAPKPRDKDSPKQKKAKRK